MQFALQKELSETIQSLFDREFINFTDNDTEVNGKTDEEKLYFYGLEMFTRGLFTGMAIEIEEEI